MSLKSYDKVPENVDLLLDLPFREGTGAITLDHASPHHKVDLVNTPVWGSLASGLGVLTFDGTNEYAEIDKTVSADLNFTSGDYSFGVWYYQEPGATVSQIIAGKYAVNISGWEIYTTVAGSLDYLSLRHHHAGGILTRSSAYSLGWEQNNWWFMGITRSDGDCQMYRNGVAVETVSLLEDPESSVARDVVIGTRYTKDTNFLNGKLYGLRVWSRAVTAAEWEIMFNRERNYFGV